MRSVSRYLCLAVLVAGCGWAAKPAVAQSSDMQSADIKAVKAVEAAWERDVATKNPDKWVGYFTEDGSGLYPGGPTLNGKAAIRAALVPMMADPNFSLTFASDRAVASKGGDMVYTQGAYTMTMTDPKTKQPMTDKGKFMTVYMKQADGSWKVVADTFNSDSPM